MSGVFLQGLLGVMVMFSQVEFFCPNSPEPCGIIGIPMERCSGMSSLEMNSLDHIEIERVFSLLRTSTQSLKEKDYTGALEKLDQVEQSCQNIPGENPAVLFCLYFNRVIAYDNLEMRLSCDEALQSLFSFSQELGIPVAGIFGPIGDEAILEQIRNLIDLSPSPEVRANLALLIEGDGESTEIQDSDYQYFKNPEPQESFSGKQERKPHFGKKLEKILNNLWKAFKKIERVVRFFDDYGNRFADFIIDLLECFGVEKQEERRL